MAKSEIRKQFEEEFRKHREAGEDTFEFNGKTYTTKLAPSAPPSGGPTRRGKGRPTPDYRPETSEESSDTSSPKSLPDWYKKYPDSFPEKYAPKDDTGSTGPQTEAQRVSRAISDFREGSGSYADARKANIQAGNRADEGILPGSTYSRQSYKKGGMVKSKSSSAKAKSGVRGAGLAVKGRGKVRMF